MTKEEVVHRLNHIMEHYAEELYECNTIMQFAELNMWLMAMTRSIWKDYKEIEE